MRRNPVLFALGIFCLVFWIADLVNIVFFIHKPAYLLWYSTSGLLLTAVALLLRSRRLISILFCALFVPEAMWSIDFLGKIIFDRHVFGLTSYMFAFSKKDFVMSLYHLFLPPILLVAVSQTRTVYRYSWLFAGFYTVALTVLTLFLVAQNEPVNCVHQLTRCRGFFSVFFTALPYPYHIFVAVALAVLIIFIPTNYALLSFGKRHSWKIL